MEWIMFPHDNLTKSSISQIQSVYTKLPSANEHARVGDYQAQFIGPWWLRKSAAPSLVLSGLPGWVGKRFIDSNRVTNILLLDGKNIEKFEMQCIEQLSFIDNKPTLALNYGSSAPIPWRWIVDELRQLDENTMLCMTIINLPLLKNFSFPFLLSRGL
jgi:hypothetical protein